jgi:hypothetical protein
MSLFNFFRRNKKDASKSDESPSPEQQQFADTALDIFKDFLSEKGFELTKTEVKQYSTTITFRKRTQYIKINSSTYPTDYPYWYNIVLGDGDSEDFFEYDWNSIALWRLKEKLEPTAEAKEYSFPYDVDIVNSLTHAKNEVIKYGDTFLNGDLTLFAQTRSEANQGREPYKIHSPDKDGNYQTTYEPKSSDMKKKYSQ